MINTVMVGTYQLLNIDLTSTTDTSDAAEKEEVQRFIRDGCGCSAKCSSMFSAGEFMTMRDSCNDLTRDEKDLFVMGEFSSNTFDSTSTLVCSPHPGDPRQRFRSCFRHRGHKVNNSNYIA